MKYFILSFLLLSSMVKADSVSWGVPVTTQGANTATLSLSNEQGEVANVTITNRMTKGNATEYLFLSEKGLSVGLYIIQQSDALPDSYEIIPESGYTAIPNKVSLREDETTTILIFKNENLLIS